MDYKKVIVAVLLVVLIISDYFMLFGGAALEKYKLIFAMFAIVSGVSLMIMVIITGRKNKIEQDKLKSNLNTLYAEKTPKKTCNICQKENKMTATYCVKCGTDLRDVTCPVCQTVNSYDQKYCLKCETILQNKKRH